MDFAAVPNLAHHGHAQRRDAALEWAPPPEPEPRAHGDETVLDLLTRRADESYELHVLRIAYAPGPEGRTARLTQLAELDNCIARPWSPGDPPYAWARRHIAVGHAQLG